MANEEQLAILRQGVEVWNNWRRDHPNIQIDLTHANLRGINLSHINLYKSNLDQVNLDDAILLEAELRSSNLRQSRICRADIRYASLAESDFNYATLRNTNLKHANLMECGLTNVDLSNSDLSNTNLEVSNLTYSRLDYVDLTQSTLGFTVFGYNDLASIKGLDTIRHKNFSVIGAPTLQISKGKIPDVFLRGCGFSDLQIETAKLLAPGLDPEQVTDITYKIHQLHLGNSIQYYSCFISYSGKDHEFAQKLHDDLQNNGVRCWFDLEDIKIGDPIRRTIDGQIRLREKFLVILSENSIQSEYVGDEVEAAFEEEQKSKRTVVFPIRIDDASMNTRDDWAAKIHRRRHVGNFSNWKDEASYKRAFEKLLRDLKSTEG